MDGIPVKKDVNYLGVVISQNERDRVSLNFNPAFEKIKRKFNLWLLRDLSLRGRVLLSKAEGISRLTYIASTIHLDNKSVNTIDQTLFNFLWKNRVHYIRKSVVVNSLNSGGLDFLDFSTLNNTLKINWLKCCLTKPSLWNFIPNFIFNQLGGLSFLLMCDYKIEKLPVKLSTFHAQALLAWKLIYKHNFSPQRYFIWNNRCILYKHKSIFLKNWFDKGIVLVSHLFNNQGYLMTYEEFLVHFNFPVTPKEFSLVFSAINSCIVSLFRDVKLVDMPIVNLTDTICGKICFSQTKNNKSIRSLFLKKVATKPCSISYWSKFVRIPKWENVWLLPHKFFVTNKVKEIYFKIIHLFYPVKHFLSKFKKDIDVNCSFCSLHLETVPHIFWHCSFVKKLWYDVSVFISEKVLSNFILHFENVVFGYFIQDNVNNKAFVINLLVLLVKFHIHRCKFSNRKPCFTVFYKELESYFCTIQSSTNRKAIKTVRLCSVFKIFE